jgi:hypothetical protein
MNEPIKPVKREKWDPDWVDDKDEEEVVVPYTEPIPPIKRDVWDPDRIDDRDKEDVMTPYTEKKPAEAYEAHEIDEAGYKSPYVTDELEPDRAGLPAKSPHTKTVPESEEEAEKPLSPHTTPKAYTPDE